MTGGAEESLRECAEAVTHADEAGDLDDVTGRALSIRRVSEALV